MPFISQVNLAVILEELETVIPQIGGLVKIVNGAYRGSVAKLFGVDTEKLCAKVQIEKVPLGAMAKFVEDPEVARGHVVESFSVKTFGEKLNQYLVDIILPSNPPSKLAVVVSLQSFHRSFLTFEKRDGRYQCLRFCDILLASSLIIRCFLLCTPSSSTFGREDFAVSIYYVFSTNFSAYVTIF
ncbi:hypothetical protein F2Q68_00006923 [Brassica cretica]|uniref:Kin17 KOW domain-containing protein n=1 Tax=Brassica cretica TaxID=69181 RepID=A0A8S9J7G5_BRACR|nr:hypothetical protein F2Q68_00006923 [Brassica cretica]